MLEGFTHKPAALLLVLLTLANCQYTPGQTTLSNVRFELGQEEDVNQNGLRYVPDGGISFLKQGGNLKVWIPASRETYLLQGSSLDSLSLSDGCVFGPSYPGGPVCRSGPSGPGFDKDYAAPGSVIQLPGSSELLMFYHGEDHGCGMAQARVGIGLARSSDGGLTWQAMGKILGGQVHFTTCQGFNGAGQPSALVMPDGFVYVYYVDWNGQSADEIQVARAPLSSLANPSAWHKYIAGEGWLGNGLDGSSSAVIHRGEPGDRTVYAALPHVSYNVFLGRYLAILTSRDGFYFSTSTDGLDWEPAQMLWEFPPGTGDGCDRGHSIWYSYASFLSPTQVSQQVSSEAGYLYYARGTCGQTHQIKRRMVRLWR